MCRAPGSASIAIGPFMVTAIKRDIIREIRGLHSRRVPLNISAVKRNHPKLIKRVYAVRPFWGWKHALEDAGLDYTKINIELRDYVDCKICGRDFGGLSYHLISQHSITPEDYRREYPEAEIVCETTRAGIVQRKLRKRPVLPRWEKIWTPEYVLDRMAELHWRKFPLNFAWSKEREKALNAQALLHFGSWDEALRRIGLDPAQIRLFRPTWRGRSPWRGADKAAILAELRRRHTAREPLSWKKIVHTQYGPAFLNRATILFGTWGRALATAGLDPFGGAKSPWRMANKAAILVEIRRRKHTAGSLRSKEIEKEKWGQSLWLRAKGLFGCWNAALLAAGVEHEGGPSQWAKADKADILAEIRRRKRTGESLRVTKILRERWGRALLDRSKKLFGSWNASLRRVGLEPAKETSPWPKADRAAIVAEIRRRKRAGESLQTTKIESEKWGHPLMKRAKTLFGSWSAALLAAGVDLPAGLTSPWPKADKAEILAEIRQRHRARKSLRYSQVVAEKWGSPLLKRAESLFGSWTAALLKAGVDLPAGAFSPWPTADKAEILAEIRRRHRAGESVRFSIVGRQQWGKPLLRRATILFGSWNDALRVAGISVTNRRLKRANRAILKRRGVSNAIE